MVGGYWVIGVKSRRGGDRVGQALPARRGLHSGDRGAAKCSSCPISRPSLQAAPRAASQK